MASRILAARLGSNEATLRKQVQRLRQRYGELLRQEIERTIHASLGEQLYGSFAQGPGQWVQSLGKAMNFSLR